MQQLTKLFHLLEITRKQPQYGYALWGGDMRLGNLAEHQYMVAMIAWQLAEYANARGGELDCSNVMRIALLHDIGELFGGDISAYYARANPVARGHAKAFESANQKFLAKFLDDAQQDAFAMLSADALETTTDEARVVKLADFMECTHYKKYMNSLTDSDVTLAQAKFATMLSEISDQTARAALSAFCAQWQEDMKQSKTFGETVTGILSES